MTELTCQQLFSACDSVASDRAPTSRVTAAGPAADPCDPIDTKHTETHTPTTTNTTCWFGLFWFEHQSLYPTILKPLFLSGNRPRFAAPPALLSSNQQSAS